MRQSSLKNRHLRMPRKANRTDRRGAAMVEAALGVGLLTVILWVSYEAYRVYTISINSAIAGRTVMKAAAYSQSFDDPSKRMETLTGYYMSHFEDSQFFLGEKASIYSPDLLDDDRGVYEFLIWLGDEMTGSSRVRVETRMQFKRPAAIFNTFGLQNPRGGEPGEGQIPDYVTFKYDGVCPINSFSLDNVNFFEVLSGWLTTEEGRPSDGTMEYIDTGD